MKLKWLRTALANLAHIADRQAETDPIKARQIVSKIRLAINNLTKHPAMGRPGRVEGTRELVIIGSPYIVIYREQQTDIEILRILHSSQRWPKK
jgi:toxin ParE1/3/4